jgi:Amt family ammonium transporter
MINTHLVYTIPLLKICPGYAFAFGGQDESTKTTFLGTQDFVSAGPSPAFWFFQYAFSATSVTIVAGTLAERCQMAAYLCYSVFLAGFIYPIVAHSMWSNNGFLSQSNIDPFLGVGAIDFAGSGVVHVTGGCTALYATIVLGARRGRFHDSQGEKLDVPKEFPGHSVALQLLGTMILWFGWFGFNGGSALILSTGRVGANAANAAVSTALSGATGGVSALVTNLWLEERRTGEPHFSLKMCMNGALSGLVAITASCALVEPWAAVVIGMVAGWLYIWGSQFLVRVCIDDAVDAIPVHMINGLWGLLAVGFFASPRKLELAYEITEHSGWFYNFSDGRLLGAQACAALWIVGWTFFTMFPFFIWLNYQGWLRADSLEELVGLDISYHGGMHTTASGVKKEFVEAYNKHKGGIRKRPNRGGSTMRGKETSEGDPEADQEAAARESLEDPASLRHDR